ncbi:hypothetical protein AUK22_05645 [bacterium CG2_30_54_10]|nr:MAG: hypothetical protein AUK22_05645 [bacterium CG2_30_54_10]
MFFCFPGTHNGISSIIRGKNEGRLEGAKHPTAGDEPREFTSRGEGGRVSPFIEKLLIMLLNRTANGKKIWGVATEDR